MATKVGLDVRTRLRIAEWTRRKMREREIPTVRALSRVLGIHEATVSKLLSGKGALGLDVFVAVHRKLHIDANQLLDFDPPGLFGPPPNGQNPGQHGQKTGPSGAPRRPR